MLKLTAFGLVLFLIEPFHHCDLLTDGKYKMLMYIKIYDLKEIDSLRIRIADDSFTKYTQNGDSALSKMNWVDSCAFILKHITREFGDSDLELTYGLPVIKLEKKISDTIFIKLRYTKLGEAYSFNGSFIKSN